MSEDAGFMLPPRAKKRRSGALAGQIGNSFEPLVPVAAQPEAVQPVLAEPLAPVAPVAPEQPAPMPTQQPTQYVAPAPAPAPAAAAAAPAAPVAAAQPNQFIAPVNEPTPAPVVKPPRKARPVTTGKLALNLPFTTMQRLDNTFAHLYQTGQMERKSHLVSQAIIELCERLEAEQNDGVPFPESKMGSAPTGAPRKPGTN